jgi:exodeoxyribonuclease-1
MANTFFFYDLETSGLDPRQARIMQFAGIRTDMDLNVIGEPYNVLVKLGEDTLPSPEALMVTGITPQQTHMDGVSETEFARLLTTEICTEGTVMTGFNNIRFDDEFIRYHLWRNFHDPYEWCWKDGRSRWDLLDVVRMTRALRPEGIVWPVVDGKATNRLELLTKENGIDHFKAHDALSDVEALIAVTRLVKEKQPQLYEYLFKLRDKNEVKKVVDLENRRPFVYSSGRYDAEHHKTTVAFPLVGGKNGNVIVYDLRHDPADFLGLSHDELVKKMYASWEERQAEDFKKLPLKELQYNRAPAVAPLGVLEQENGWENIHLNKEVVERHLKTLRANPQFTDTVRLLFEARPAFKKAADPEAQLYDGFVKDRDRLRIETVRNATERELAGFRPEFVDSRLSPLFLRYKARNFPKSLDEDEAREWEMWRNGRIAGQLPRFMTSLQRLGATVTDKDRQFVLQELQLWAETVMPSDVEGQENG